MEYMYALLGGVLVGGVCVVLGALAARIMRK